MPRSGWCQKHLAQLLYQGIEHPVVRWHTHIEITSLRFSESYFALQLLHELADCLVLLAARWLPVLPESVCTPASHFVL